MNDCQSASAAIRPLSPWPNSQRPGAGDLEPARGWSIAIYMPAPGGGRPGCRGERRSGGRPASPRAAQGVDMTIEHRKSPAFARPPAGAGADRAGAAFFCTASPTPPAAAARQDADCQKMTKIAATISVERCPCVSDALAANLPTSQRRVGKAQRAHADTAPVAACGSSKARHNRVGTALGPLPTLRWLLSGHGMQGRTVTQAPFIVTPAPFIVTPAKAGVQSLTTLDSGFRRNDEGVGVT